MPIPWMNFSVVSLLSERLGRDIDLFEFGSGYSTLFFAARVSRVTAIEHDPQWFATIASQVPANVELILQDQDQDGDYCRAIMSRGRQYDVVVVDGRDRVNCMKQSLPALAPGGVVILDDSHRDRYQEGIDLFRARGFRALSIEGLKATDAGTHRTTIFYREGNCLDL